MSKSVVTAASAGRAKVLSRAKVLREKENNHKPAAEEAAASSQHDAQAAHLAPTHASDVAMSDVSLAGDFSFTGVMADAAASADFMAASAGFTGMAGLAQDTTSDSGGGLFNGDSTPLIIGGVVLVGAGVAIAASGGDDNDSPTPTPVPTPTPTPNAAPAFTASSLAVTGNEDATISGKIVATDSNNDTLTYAVKGAAPAGFTLNTTTGEYSLDATNAAYQGKNDGETLTVTVPVTVTDGKVASPVESSLVITVNGKSEGPTTQAITLNAQTTPTSNTDAENVNTTYTVQQGNYNYTIIGLDAGGDKIVGTGGVAPTVINDSFTDNKVVVQYAFDANNIVKITLDNLTSQQDGQILGLNSLNTVFGAGTVA